MNRGLRINKQYLIFLLLFYFFISKNWLEQYWSFIGYGDELVALLAIPIFIIKLYKNHFLLKIHGGGYGKCIAIFIISGLLGNAVYQYQSFFKVAVPDAFLCLKFWLALYVGKNVLSRFSIRRYAKKIYNHVRFVTAVYVICYFFDLKFHLFKASIRYGMRCTQLMYSHSTVFVACCVFLIGILLAVSNYNNDWKKCLGILLFLMCTTLRSKAW